MGTKRQVGTLRMYLGRRSVGNSLALGLTTTIVDVHGTPLAGDAKVYENTVKEVQSGTSPLCLRYRAFTTQQCAQQQRPTMNYIYPPMTLPLVRAIGLLPAWLRISASVCSYLSAAWLLCGRGELPRTRRAEIPSLAFSACIFFPGLLNDDFFLAGNIAPILYGLVCAAPYGIGNSAQ